MESCKYSWPMCEVENFRYENYWIVLQSKVLSCGKNFLLDFLFFHYFNWSLFLCFNSDSRTVWSVGFLTSWASKSHMTYPKMTSWSAPKCSAKFKLASFNFSYLASPLNFCFNLFPHGFIFSNYLHRPCHSCVMLMTCSFGFAWALIFSSLLNSCLCSLNFPFSPISKGEVFKFVLFFFFEKLSSK